MKGFNISMHDPRWLRAFTRSTLTILLLSLAIPSARAQGLIWGSTWSGSAPPAFALPSYDYLNPYPGESKASPVTFGINGDILLISPSQLQLDDQILHLDANGALLWATNFYVQASAPGTVASSILSADGGAFVAFGGSSDLYGYPDYVASIDPAGATRWLRTISARQVLMPSAQILIAAGADGVTALDPATGNVRWEFRGCSGKYGCSFGGIVAGGDSNLYAIYYANPSKCHVVKLDLAGASAWDVEIGGPVFLNVGPAAAPIGVVGTELFLRAGGDIRALQTADGSPLWTNAIGASDALLAGAPPEPVAMSNGSVSRLAADTGSPRWTVTVPDAPVDIAAVAGASLIVHSATGLSRIDAETGTVQWTNMLPASIPTGESLHYLAVGATDAGHLVAVAEASSAIYGSWPPAHLEQVDFATGNVIGEIALPVVTQGLYGASVVGDSGDVFAAAQDSQASVLQLRVQRINSVDGTPDWSSVEPLPAAIPNIPVYGFLALAPAGSGVVASASLDSELWLGMFEASNGKKRWTHEQREIFQAYTYPSSPVADADGNVFISYGMYTRCSYDFCSNRILAKFSAVDGSEVWRFYTVQGTFGGPLPQGFSQVFAPLFSLMGSDVLAIGPFGGANYASTLVKLSGIDGSVQWSSSVLGAPSGVSDAHALSDGSVIAVGDGWAKLNGLTGQTIWASPPVTELNSCISPCYTYSSLYLDNGDYLGAGENGGLVEIVRLRGDGSGIADFWYPDANATRLRSSAHNLQIDAQGRIWLTLQRHLRTGSPAVQFLAQLDVSNGSFLGEQAIGTFNDDITDVDRTVVSLLGPPANNRVVVQTFEQLHPQPTTTGNATLDTTVSAHGDLAIHVSTIPLEAMPGSSVTFHITATYTGDTSISGAMLRASMPWPTGISNLSCIATAATNCALNAKAGNLRATFDVQPGGQVDIYGDVTYFDMRPDTATIGIAVYGPIGLLEQDTVNNFARATIMESPFFNGFE